MVSAKLIFTALCMSLALGAPSVAGHRLADLPLTTTPTAGRSDTMAVLFSGDGGWAAIDQGVADDFSRAGVPVVGFDSLRYFMVRKAPQEAADDLALALRSYMPRWGRSHVILAGYSFGADALTAIVPHLPADLRARVRLVALVGAGDRGEMQFQPGDWFNHAAADAFPLRPALGALRGVRTVCIYGARDPTAVCPSLPASVIRSVRLNGDHHFDRGYAPVGEAILRAAGL